MSAWFDIDSLQVTFIIWSHPNESISQYFLFILNFAFALGSSQYYNSLIKVLISWIIFLYSKILCVEGLWRLKNKNTYVKWKKWIVRKMLMTFTSMAETQANKKQKTNEKRGGLRVQKRQIKSLERIFKILLLIIRQLTNYNNGELCFLHLFW